jgi:hypothetical protein
MSNDMKDLDGKACKGFTLKEAVAYSNKKIVKMCGDGLMKDIMKACVGWFIKLAYGEGYVLIAPPGAMKENDAQLDLFSIKDEEAAE